MLVPLPSYIPGVFITVNLLYHSRTLGLSPSNGSTPLLYTSLIPSWSYIINGRQASTFIPIDFSYPSTNISVSYGPCSEFLEYSLELTLRTADCTPFVCVSLSFGMLRSSSKMDYRVLDTSCVVPLARVLSDCTMRKGPKNMVYS